MNRKLIRQWERDADKAWAFAEDARAVLASGPKRLRPSDDPASKAALAAFLDARRKWAEAEARVALGILAMQDRGQ
jgi:hypothetical protein